MLLLQRGHHRHHRFHKAGAFRTLRPKAPLAPQNPWPNRPLGGVVRGLYPFVPYERPQGLPQFEGVSVQFMLKPTISYACKINSLAFW